MYKGFNKLKNKDEILDMWPSSPPPLEHLLDLETPTISLSSLDSEPLTHTYSLSDINLIKPYIYWDLQVLVNEEEGK